MLIGRASIEPRAFMSTPNGADAQAAAQAASAQVAKAHLPRRLGIAAPPPGGPQPVGPAGGPGDGTLRPEEALLNSSPYLKSMALLDGLDLQQLMSGGDLAVARSRGVEGKGRFRPVRAVRRSGGASTRGAAVTRARARRELAATRGGTRGGALPPGAETRAGEFRGRLIFFPFLLAREARSEGMSLPGRWIRRS